MWSYVCRTLQALLLKQCQYYYSSLLIGLKYDHEVGAEDFKVRIIWKVKYRVKVAKKLILFLDNFEICCKTFWIIFSYIYKNNKNNK